MNDDKKKVLRNLAERASTHSLALANVQRQADLAFTTSLTPSLEKIMTAADQFQKQIDDVFRQHRVLETIQQVNQRVDESLSLLAPHLVSALSAADHLQKHLASVLRQNHVLESIEQMSRQIAGAYAGITASAEFQKFDSLLRSITISAEFYQKPDIARAIEQVARPVIDAFVPAALAYDKWRASEEVATLQQISPSIPAREQFLSTDVVVALQERVIYPEEALHARNIVIVEVEDQLLLTLPPALGRIDTDLYRLWRGAWEAFGSSNPDRIRHSVTSLRELLTHVLHALAPDDDVRGWTSNPAHYHSGRPTRRARFLFVLSRIDGENLRRYLEKEAESCSALMEAFQPGTHEIVPAFSDIQLKVMLRKAHSIIGTLLEIWENTK